jgi:hypothetical protein
MPVANIVFNAGSVTPFIYSQGKAEKRPTIVGSNVLSMQRTDTEKSRPMSLLVSNILPGSEVRLHNALGQELAPGVESSVLDTHTFLFQSSSATLKVYKQGKRVVSMPITASQTIRLNQQTEPGYQ